MIDENIRNMRCRLSWPRSSFCHLLVSARHSYGKCISVLHSQQWALFIQCDKFEEFWCGEPSEITFAFQPFCDYPCLVYLAYSLIAVTRHVQREEFLLYSLIHVLLSSSGKLLHSASYRDCALLTNFGANFCVTPSIFYNQPRAMLLLASNSDAPKVTFVVAFPQYASFASPTGFFWLLVLRLSFLSVTAIVQFWSMTCYVCVAQKDIFILRLYQKAHWCLLSLSGNTSAPQVQWLLSYDYMTFIS